MSFNNTPESCIRTEEAILAEVSYILRASCSCDINSVCNNCSFKMGEIKDADREEKRTINQDKNEYTKQTVDSPTNQNWVADLHRRADSPTNQNRVTDLQSSVVDSPTNQNCVADLHRRTVDSPTNQNRVADLHTSAVDSPTNQNWVADLQSNAVDSPTNQYWVTDLYSSDELVYKNNSNPHSSEEHNLSLQNDAGSEEDKNNSEVYPCDRNSDFVCDRSDKNLTDKKNVELWTQDLTKENVFYSHKVKEDETEDKSEVPVFLSDCNTLEESNDATSVEAGLDSRRTRRNSKRKRDAEDCCPVCGVTIRCSELASHFAKEVENLSKIPRSSKRRLEDNNGVSTTYVQVKTNRENRHAAKIAMFSSRPKNEVHCPVCSLRLTGTQDEINSHVLNCINEDDNYEEVNVVDSDGEDSFEEYEFADQRRIRAISLVPGGYRSLHGEKRSRNACEENEDLNVDVDDTLAFGNPQYTELDVIHNASGDSSKEEDELRKAVLLDSRAERHILESNKWGNDNNINVDAQDSCSTSEKSKIEENANHESSIGEKCEKVDDKNSGNKAADHVVSSLKEKIKDLEEQDKSVKCLICLEAYTKPLVSTTCWHVHCEECWLMTMGVKKLCPQCNMIVFPSDLRRIYL